VLAGYEWFASQQVAPGRIPAWTALRVGAIAHAISNTLGFHALTASLLRYHLYRPLGLGKGEVARLMIVVAACLAAGVAVTVLLAMGWLKAGLPGLGAAIGVSLCLGWLMSAATKRLRRATALSRLDPTRTIVLLVIGVLETLAALVALYVLLPATTGTPTLAQFIPIFVGATLLGVVSHAPGGVGVFEAAILALVPGHAAELLVSLLCYRLIYNLLPFSAAAALALASLPSRRDRVSSRVGNAGWHVAGGGIAAPASRCPPDDGRAGGWQR
jgi:uncharacterized membrane protein YbhN (UPF0104 family)